MLGQLGKRPNVSVLRAKASGDASCGGLGNHIPCIPRFRIVNSGAAKQNPCPRDPHAGTAESLLPVPAPIVSAVMIFQ